jgi:hypothetical protein
MIINFLNMMVIVIYHQYVAIIIHCYTTRTIKLSISRPI